MRRAVAMCLLALAAIGAAGCGDDERKQKDPFEAISRGPAPVRHGASPRWEHLATLSGPGSKTRPVEIDSRAIQWRARWRCRTGSLEIAAEPAPRGGNPLTRADCPRRGGVESIQTGPLEIRAEGSGRWLVKIEQQVDTPLADPPLPGMDEDRLVAKGEFYEVDRPATGTAEVYRLPGGRLALRLENFETSANIDLFVWLSEAPRPRTTKAAARAPYVVASELKSTMGDQNYLLPAGTNLRDIRSIVIWCEPVRNVYTAAALRPVDRAGAN